MEIIDKSHQEFTSLYGRKARNTISFFKDGTIYFSKLAVKDFDLKAGMKVHFVSDVNRIYVFFNQDESGLALHNDTSGALKLQGISVMAILNKKYPTKIKPQTKYLLRRCLTKINESTTVEILLNNPVNKY